MADKQSLQPPSNQNHSYTPRLDIHCSRKECCCKNDSKLIYELDKMFKSKSDLLLRLAKRAWCLIINKKKFSLILLNTNYPTYTQPNMRKVNKPSDAFNFQLILQCRYPNYRDLWILYTRSYITFADDKNPINDNRMNM